MCPPFQSLGFYFLLGSHANRVKTNWYNCPICKNSPRSIYFPIVCSTIFKEFLLWLKYCGGFSRWSQDIHGCYHRTASHCSSTYGIVCLKPAFPGFSVCSKLAKLKSNKDYLKVENTIISWSVPFYLSKIFIRCRRLVSIALRLLYFKESLGNNTKALKMNHVCF